MSVTKKKNSLYTWRAILHGRDALRLRLIKRVGDGNNIRIWEDPWIPDNPCLKSILKPMNANAVLVEDLFDHGTGLWNIQALQENLIPYDMEKVQ